MLDERFLTIHPATAAWMERAKKCESCANLVLTEGQVGEGIMRCAAVQNQYTIRWIRKAHEKRGIENSFCIDARDENGKCGPEARLFKPINV